MGFRLYILNTFCKFLFKVVLVDKPDDEPELKDGNETSDLRETADDILRISLENVAKLLNRVDHLDCIFFQVCVMKTKVLVEAQPLLNLRLLQVFEKDGRVIVVLDLFALVLYVMIMRVLGSLVVLLSEAHVAGDEAVEVSHVKESRFAQPSYLDVKSVLQAACDVKEGRLIQVILHLIYLDQLICL